MKRSAFGIFALLAALCVEIRAQNLEIPPPIVSEPTPIPLPAIQQPTPPSALIPAPSGAGLFVPQAKSEMQDLIPTLVIKDMRKAVDFYTGKLGFAVALESGGNYTAVARDFVQFGLVQDKNAPKGRSGSCYIKMASVDVFYDELMKRGVKLTSELKTQPSKMREFSVTDPDGNVLIFGEYTGPK